MTTTGMVACPQPEAAEAGIDVLRQGGNAIDAALACALVQTVVDPLMCGIAGFGSLGVYMPGRDVHEYIDFHAPAPAATTDSMWAHLIEGQARDGFGFILKGRVNDVGYQSVCVPGSLKAYAEAHRDYGRLAWKDIVAPAIQWARNGYFVRPAMFAFWSDEGSMGRTSNAERLAFSQAGRALYCRPDGTPKRIGDSVKNTAYAETLSQIAEGGADVFYRGEIADRIAADMKANGGLLSKSDLENYRPVRAKPLVATYRGHRITTNQPPGGGLMLIEMLNILESFDLKSLGHNSTAYIRLLSETMKRATNDKDKFIGDPAFVDVPVSRLASKDYAATLAEDIRRGTKAEVPRLMSPAAPVSKDTTHVSVVDGEGNCVSMTHSLGMPSGVITEGLGFMYNGCMGVFDPRPGQTGSAAPGKSRFSAMCPSIVFDPSGCEMVIGAPGGTQIVMGVLQAILNAVDFGMTMQEAVSAPRFSSTSSAIDVTNRIPRSVMRPLEEEGYEVIRNPFGYTIGWVHAVRRTSAGLEGAADPGRDGVAYAIELPAKSHS
jgi:gamma-glutamyltranspeptidase/glutathione hydrolase